jgi:hypothetical protein
VDHLDEEIERTRTHLIHLLKRRNLSSPSICVLPSEVLSQIFIMTQRALREFERKWIALAHVCHQWRQVALITPHLWTAVDYRTPAATRDFITRATALPLAISVSTKEIAVFREAQKNVNCAHRLLIDVEPAEPYLKP